MMKDLIINGSRQLDIPLDDVQVDKLMEYARLLSGTKRLILLR